MPRSPSPTPMSPLPHNLQVDRHSPPPRCITPGRTYTSTPLPSGERLIRRVLVRSPRARPTASPPKRLQLSPQEVLETLLTRLLSPLTPLPLSRTTSPHLLLPISRSPPPLLSGTSSMALFSDPYPPRPLHHCQSLPEYMVRIWDEYIQMYGMKTILPSSSPTCTWTAKKPRRFWLSPEARREEEHLGLLQIPSVTGGMLTRRQLGQIRKASQQEYHQTRQRGSIPT